MFLRIPICVVGHGLRVNVALVTFAFTVLVEFEVGIIICRDCNKNEL